MVINARGLKKSFSTRVLFSDVCFHIAERDHMGFAGANGAGKTTLFRILMGLDTPDEGELYINRESRIASMEQSVEAGETTLYESALGVFRELMDMERELEAISDALSARDGENCDGLLKRQAALSDRYDSMGGATFRSRTRATLMGLGFDETELDTPLGVMSGGERNKAQLARVLLSGASLLLLDEPTNHLDIDGIRYLEDYLSGYSGAFIVISHDRYFLDRVTNRTMELKNGKMSVTDGNYSRHVELLSSEQETIRRKYIRTQREIKRIEGIVEQQRRFGRERNFITAASKQKQIERLTAGLVAPDKNEASIHFSFHPREVGGNDVLIAKGLKKSYDKPVFKDVSLHIRRGEHVFLLGSNGCGKTTLLKLIMGRENADGGEVSLGAKISRGYYEQHMTSLSPKKTVIEEIRDEYPKMTDTDIRNALASFLFRGDDVFKTVELLSGGERARVQLLKLMLAGENLLLLDEPTNHLDIASREALETALEDYGGTMLIVTHDRYLVNRLADRILYMESDGVTEYIGGYDDMLEARALAAEYRRERDDRPLQLNAYKLKKQRQSAYNHALGELKRLEERISQSEASLHKVHSEMAEHAADYAKIMELTRRAEAIEAETAALYSKWEEAEEKTVELLAELEE